MQEHHQFSIFTYTPYFNNYVHLPKDLKFVHILAPFLSPWIVALIAIKTTHLEISCPPISSNLIKFTANIPTRNQGQNLSFSFSKIEKQQAIELKKKKKVKHAHNKKPALITLHYSSNILCKKQGSIQIHHSMSPHFQVKTRHEMLAS